MASARPKKSSARTTRSNPQTTKVERQTHGEARRVLCAEHSMCSDPFWPPISDPTKEKQILEDKGHVAWIEWLQEGVKDCFAYHPTDEMKRITEVYRLCFEQSKRKDTSIIGDFVAHHPRLVLSGWVAEVAEQWNITALDETITGRNRLLKAISNGFRRASSSSWNQRLRRGRLSAAREFRLRLSRELTSFHEGFKDSPAEWWSKQVEKNVSDLVRENPQLSSLTGELRTKLSTGQIYKAAVLIAATIFGVRERDLETKAPKSRPPLSRTKNGG